MQQPAHVDSESLDQAWEQWRDRGEHECRRDAQTFGASRLIHEFDVRRIASADAQGVEDRIALQPLVLNRPELEANQRWSYQWIADDWIWYNYYMILRSLVMERSDLEGLGGWEFKAEGTCRGERCVPLAETADGRVDVEDMARRLRMPIVHDEEHGLWALGPEGGGRFLQSAVCPDIVLPDLDGNPFSLSSLLGTKVLLVAWASW